MNDRLQTVFFYVCVAVYTLPLGYGTGLVVGYPVALEIVAKLAAILGIAVAHSHAR